MVRDDLRSVVDQVCGTDFPALCDGKSIVELHRCLARLEAATTRAVASFDARREWDADGARSAAAWLTGRCRLPRTSARRRVRRRVTPTYCGCPLAPEGRPVMPTRRKVHAFSSPEAGLSANAGPRSSSRS